MVSSHCLCAWPSQLVFTPQFNPLHTACPSLPVGLHRIAQYGSKNSGGPHGPRLHNTTAYREKNQGCLAQHHSPNRDDSQTLGRFFSVEYLSSNVLGFAGYCVRLGRRCDLNTLVAMWLPGGGASRRGLGL